MASPELNVNLLSKSSPSQLPAFQFKRSRTQPIPTEAFYSSQQQQQQQKAGSKPSNLSHVPCKFYKQGTCTAGANCTFSHSSDLSSESAVCKYFVKGNCKFGTKCALLHTMSPYGGNGNGNMDRKSSSNRPMVATPPVPPLPMSLAATGRRKTDQVYSTSSEHRLFLDSFGATDPFATSAPSFSLLRQLDDHQQASMWRNNSTTSTTSTTPRTSLPSNDFIGLHPSPRESSDHLLGTSPFRQQQQYPVSSSLRSNTSTSLYQNGGGGNGSSSLLGGVNASGLADSHLGYSMSRSMMNGSNEDGNSNSYISINNGSSSYHNHISNGNISSNSNNNNHSNYDLNDAMLPSSLNDLFTPSELHVRRVRQQEQYPLSYSPSRESNMLPAMSDSLPNWSASDVAHYSSSSTLDNNMQKLPQQQWRVPFLHKTQQQYELASDYEDRLIEGTAAINIPGGKGSINGESGSNNSSNHYQQDDLLPATQDDDVQFFMEDDEAVTYDTNDHKITESMTNTSSSTSYPFPSFVTLPTSSQS